MPASKEIRGNTLKVYMYLLRHGPSELRDIQRGLSLSSASLASYHLARLIESGYATQDEQGRYVAVKEASHQIVDGYAKIGPAVVPQLFFFTVLFTILTAFFSSMILFEPSYAVYLSILCMAMVAVLWYETIRLWRRLAV